MPSATGVQRQKSKTVTRRLRTKDPSKRAIATRRQQLAVRTLKMFPKLILDPPPPHGAKLVRFADGEPIRLGVSDCFLLTEGEIAVRHTGSETVLKLTDGTLIGRTSFGLDIPKECRLTAEDAAGYYISEQALAKMLGLNARGVKVMQQLGQRTLQAEEAVLNEVRNVPNRLAALLLELANKNNEVLDLSHQELADALSTYRETVTKTLLDMAGGPKKNRPANARGLIEQGRRKIRLKDLAGLQALASAI